MPFFASLVSYLFANSNTITKSEPKMTVVAPEAIKTVAGSDAIATPETTKINWNEQMIKTEIKMSEKFKLNDCKNSMGENDGNDHDELTIHSDTKLTIHTKVEFINKVCQNLGFKDIIGKPKTLYVVKSSLLKELLRNLELSTKGTYPIKLHRLYEYISDMRRKDLEMCFKD